MTRISLRYVYGWVSRIGMEGFSKEEDSLFITAALGAIHHRL